MQVKFKRYFDHKTGLLGGSTTYNLEAVVLPTEEEDELIKRFEQWGNSLWLHSKHEHTEHTDEKMYRQLLTTHLIQLRPGHRFTFSKPEHVFIAEKVVLEAVQYTLTTIRALASFDGTERVLAVTEDGYDHAAVG